jgi:glycosyltransferase involved in cell wall biosynthesis
MQILMLSRSDLFDVPGGDTIQMVQTKVNLEKLGVKVKLQTVQEIPDVSQYDIVHIFNWQELVPVIKLIGFDAFNKTKLILSPIFWFHTGHWFQEAKSKKILWKFLNNLVDPRRVRKVFEEWQQFKFRWGSAGREFRQALSVPVKLLPNSKIEIDHLSSVFGLRQIQEKCLIVPNGVIRELYQSLPSPNELFRREYGIEGFVIQVARIQSAKNQAGLIEALKDTPVPIVFIGQPSPYEPEYVNYCHLLAGQRGNVYFIGSLPTEELSGIYALAGVHAMPSWRETPGLASLEAAAAGCRIVTTSIGSAREYFGDNAWYCDPGDLDSIKQAVNQALESPPSDRLRQLILDRFTWQVAAEKTLEVYKQILH